MASEMKENHPTTAAVKEERMHASHSPTSKENQHISPKRKTSEAHTSAEARDAAKKKRRKVNHACVYCRRSHMTCDLERPCARCVKRDIGHLCHDEPREPPKRSKSDVGVAAPDLALAAATEENKQGQTASGNGITVYRGDGHGSIHVNGNAGRTDGGPTLVQPTPERQAPAGGNNLVQAFDWSSNGVANQFQDIHHLHPTFNMFNTHEVSQEYNVLNDFLNNNLFDGGNGGLFGGEDSTQGLFGPPMGSGVGLTSSLDMSSSGSTNIAPPAPSHAAAHEISRPTSTLPIDSRAREKFYLTAADPSGLSSPEERLHKLLKAKYDAGMLKPFNYVKGYARLNQYMSQHLSRESQLRVLQQLNGFRPGFRKAMHSLTDMQLVLVEMWFERSLMEYDRVFASMAIPACCWRRTGEVFRANTEMAELIHQPLDRLRDGKIAIHEIIAEESLVSYWEKFGAIAFDPKQKAILTSCTLKRPVKPAPEVGHGHEGKNGDAGKQETELIKCCFSFTIRRDLHNM